MITEINPVKEELREFTQTYIRSLEILNKYGVNDDHVLVGNVEISVDSPEKLDTINSDDRTELFQLGWTFDFITGIWYFKV